MRFWRFDNLENAPLTVDRGSVICPECSHDLFISSFQPYFAEKAEGIEFVTHFQCSCCEKKFGFQGVIS